MSCAVRTLAICLAAMLSGATAAETLEMRIIGVVTGLDLGDGAGRPPSDYYVDGGRADGLAPGMRLPVYRKTRIEDAARDRKHAVRLLGELEVLGVFEDAAVARVSRIELAADAPLFEPRGMMTGDVVLHPTSGVSRNAGAPGVAAATVARTQPVRSDGGPGQDSLAPLSFPSAPEAFPPGFPSADEWYPLPPPVLFELDSADLDPAAQLGLEGVARVLTGNPERLIALEGRTCDLGNKVYNHALSLRRARVVAAFLQSRGVVAERLSVTGLGESSPVTPNTSESARRNNRRVDLRLGTVGPTLEPEIPGSPQ